MVGAANIERIPGKSFSALLTDENQTVVLEIPNGSYRFGAIGYTKSGNGSKISNNLRCAGANNGAIYNLNGQTIVLDLVLSQETCTDALFGPLSERDAGHPTNVPQIEFASCTGALPTAAEAGCTGGSGIVIVRYCGSSACATGGQISTSGPHIVHVFTESGYFTPTL